MQSHCLAFTIDRFLVAECNEAKTVLNQELD